MFSGPQYARMLFNFPESANWKTVMQLTRFDPTSGSIGNGDRIATGARFAGLLCRPVVDKDLLIERSDLRDALQQRPPYGSSNVLSSSKKLLMVSRSLAERARRYLRTKSTFAGVSMIAPPE